MRTRRLLATLVALVIVTGSGAVALGQGSTPAGASPAQAPAAKPPRNRSEIQRAATSGRPRAATTSAVNLATTPAGAASVGGAVEVTIPPVVLIRLRPRRLVVTTNTGVLPRPSDQFWILRERRATPADAAVQAEVLADCTAWTPPLTAGQRPRT